MLLVSVYLAQSALEGIGVFAKEPIPQGTLVWRMQPDYDRLIPNALYEAETGPVRLYLDRYCYPSRAHPGHIVFEADDARYMNHSDDPNLDVSDENNHFAIRPIAPGEELTCDYNRFFPESGFEFLGSR
ncbi:MAG: SET domain-containing protein-lysine N-methyltransferase [Mesorhizobium amorphae]|nr:MAG: SET domain-containing protein-lysine N-methyltransferase [Mesorhizobium amorphae]